jgi:deoxyribodipyrimidine photo-lyase
MIQKRIKILSDGIPLNGPVIYWMSRDQRVSDNWALLYSQHLSNEKKKPLVVVFSLSPSFLDASTAHYRFLIDGLKEVEINLGNRNIRFIILFGNPEKEIPKIIKEINAGCLITDFDPLRIKQIWKNSIKDKIKIPFFEIDTHNIVPCFISSNKQEYGAYTLRPKINKLLPEFLTEFPIIKKNKQIFENNYSNNWNSIERHFKFNKSEIKYKFLPGEKSAHKVLKQFLKTKLDLYNDRKNDPNGNVVSDLSPYLHFGSISSQRIALEVLKSEAKKESKKVFLEELIIRKELSDNYCYYNCNYDNVDGFPDWAKKSFGIHKNDSREYIYQLNDLETGKTHDPLWNAAQLEMVKTGKMHGYLRMYWAKKILEWTETPIIAQKYAINLNDKYSLDGRDPNGYTGIAWSIGGVHDRPWFSRYIFGNVRYMSYNGCKSKFDVDEYIERIKLL